MQLQLSLTSDRRFLPSVAAFTSEAIRPWSLTEVDASKLAELAISAFANAMDHAYPAGEQGAIEMSIHEEHGRLAISIRDHGLPADIAMLESQLNESKARGQSFDFPGVDAADEIHWVGYGRDGKAIQIIKWLHETHVQEMGEPLYSFREDVPLAPEQEYTIRRMRLDEAVQVSQLIYRAYGNTYFNDDVYFPDRVAAQNARGSVLSFVAAGTDGQLVGHYALERNQDGPVAEGGQAVVDPAHRGRGLLDRMKDAALDEARRLELAGWYADAVSVHTMTQQSNIKHGARLCCVDLAIAPATEEFRNISDNLRQRVTCLLFFHWLQPAEPRTVFVPAHHRDVVSEIYSNLGCRFEFGGSGVATGHGSHKVSIDSDALKATIRAEQLGADSAHLIRHAKREIVERSHAEVVYAELPLFDPATPHIAEDLELEGFGFLGVAPCFGSRGDLLRMAYLVEPLRREPIKTVDAFTAKLVDYALAEQVRVQSTL